MTGPLDGVRVVDLTTVLLGPFATQILGDMGADVIKVEAPSGDITRQLGLARHPGMSSVYLNANRNKRSLVLDLKQAPARAALLKLAAGADVFVHSMRPRAIARLGLAYDDVRAVRPDIVYCGAYGFGEAGPYGEKPAYDDIIQAASGLAALQGGVTGTPSYVRSVVADKTVALTVAYSIAMALFHHERTGEGQAIEVPMFETMTAFIVVEHLYGLTFEPPMGGFGYPRVLASERRPFATQDGYLAVLPYNDRQWSALFEVAGRPDLAADARFANAGARHDHVRALYSELAAIIASRSTAEWLASLDAAHVPAMPVIAPEDLPSDPHLNAVGFWQHVEHPSEGRLLVPKVPVGLSRTPGGIRRLAPRLGEHSAESLREGDLNETEIAALMESGAAVQAE